MLVVNEAGLGQNIPTGLRPCIKSARALFVLANAVTLVHGALSVRQESQRVTFLERVYKWVCQTT